MNAKCLLAGLLFCCASSTNALTVKYEWRGFCTSGCVGEATASITLRDYIPGTPLAIGAGDIGPHHLVDFVYTDSIGTVQYNPLDFAHWHTSDFGVLPNGTGPGKIELQIVDMSFDSDL